MKTSLHPRAGAVLLLALAGVLTVVSEKAEAQTSGTSPGRSFATRPYSSYTPRTGGYYYGYPSYYASPNYAYPGYYGYRYVYPARPAPSQGNGYPPRSIYYSPNSPFVRDYSTARDLPLAKPWMRPLR